jgi:hypothetical protein
VEGLFVPGIRQEALSIPPSIGNIPNQQSMAARTLA